MRGVRVSLDRFLIYLPGAKQFTDPIQLIDFVITTHPAYTQLSDLAQKGNTSIHLGLCLYLNMYRLLILSFVSSRRPSREIAKGGGRRKLH